MSDPESTIPHESSVEAALNAPHDVTLYHPNGKSITVDPADVAFWLDQGFRQSKADPEATVAELKALFPEALDAVLRWVQGVTADGVIDPADDAAQATAQLAMRRLEVVWGQLVRDIEALYPVAQGQAVQMQTTGGQTVEVDPNQVTHYLEQGWEVVRA
jgi:hypothetical protein